MSFLSSLKLHLTREHRDPVTGDALSTLEYVIRQVQVAVRTPWFIVAFNVFTLGMLVLNRMDAWNYVASWLAIVIEWLVGTFMFGQTARDAVITRRILREVLNEEKELSVIEARLEEGHHPPPIPH